MTTFLVIADVGPKRGDRLLFATDGPLPLAAGCTFHVVISTDETTVTDDQSGAGPGKVITIEDIDANPVGGTAYQKQGVVLYGPAGPGDPAWSAGGASVLAELVAADKSIVWSRTIKVVA